MSDWENPARKYKWFRPHQAARGAAEVDGPTNKGTVVLYNNSPGPSILVVRHVEIGSTAGHTIKVAQQKGAIAGNAGSIVPLWPGIGAPPGTIVALDSATIFTQSFFISVGANGAAFWPHDFPIAVVPPDHSLIFQDSSSAATLLVAVLYEYVFADQLDFSYALE